MDSSIPPLPQFPVSPLDVTTTGYAKDVSDYYAHKSLNPFEPVDPGVAQKQRLLAGLGFGKEYGNPGDWSLNPFKNTELSKDILNQVGKRAGVAQLLGQSQASLEDYRQQVALRNAAQYAALDRQNQMALADSQFAHQKALAAENFKYQLAGGLMSAAGRSAL